MYTASAMVPTDTPTAYPLMSYWVARVWHALTFLRSALCGSPAGSSYFPTGSWPNGECALAPLNLLSACRRYYRQAIALTLHSLPRGKIVSVTPLFHDAWYPRTTTTAGHPAAQICCRWRALSRFWYL